MPESGRVTSSLDSISLKIIFCSSTVTSAPRQSFLHLTLLVCHSGFGIMVCRLTNCSFSSAFLKISVSLGRFNSAHFNLLHLVTDETATPN